MTISINNYKMTKNKPPNPMSVHSLGFYPFLLRIWYFSPSHTPLMKKDGPTSRTITKSHSTWFEEILTHSKHDVTRVTVHETTSSSSYATGWYGTRTMRKYAHYRNVLEKNTQQHASTRYSKEDKSKTSCPWTVRHDDQNTTSRFDFVVE